MKTILFQGDSITYSNRSFDTECLSGSGYVTITSGSITSKEPGKYKVLNRGIGGNRVVDLYARWKKDCINLKPDIISILIGVNDVWHEVESGNGVDAENFKKIYNMLIADTLKALPNCKMVLLEPFVWKYGLTVEHWSYIKSEVEKRGEIAKELAKNYNIPFIALQSVFDDALEKAPAEFWTLDGIHPLASGHMLIANEWEKCFYNNELWL